MKPTSFEQANGILSGGPASKYGTSDDVADLAVCRVNGEVISCWRATWRDRLRVLLTGRVWLRVLADRTHSPVALDAESPFSTSEEAK
jgi:hypothetical protein